MTVDAEERLADLARRHGLDAAQRGQLASILTVLQADPHAPTSVRGPEALDVHIADSLVALDLDAVRHARAIADLGSGAGLPGLPIAVALPEATVHLLESQARKCAFIEQAADGAALTNARVVCSRAESWTQGTGVVDVALARAVAPQPVVLEYAAPLLQIGGSLVDWRGSRRPEEEAQAERAAHALGLERVAIERVEPYAAAQSLHLHVFVKVAGTPERFPRRAGMAAKRPLGG